ncbi:MAG: murein transglycosylase domain-containing protein [bacterium]
MNKFRLAILLLGVCSAFLFIAEAGAEEDLFDSLDSALEAQFQELDAELEAQYQALDKALKEAYERLEGEVEETWGVDEVELPSKAIWVDYSEDNQLRRKIDFEKGIIEIEHILTDQTEVDKVVAAMQVAAASIATDRVADLAAKDSALKYAREQLEAENISLQEYKSDDPRPVLGSIGADVPDSQEMNQLVSSVLTDKAKKGSSGNVKASLTGLSNNKKKVTIQVPLRLGYQTTLASRYRESVIREAQRHDLPASLVYAVIETESSFNPRARSPVPAFGLMQLVPRSGGMDAYNHVYGEKLLLDPEYLYDAEQNVELGAAYLNLLYTRYLRHIKNPESRQYCTIAAYNTGAGNVARTFVGSNNVREAAKTINNMTPQAVYDYLVANLPHEETRNYLQKVTKAQAKYSSMDQYVSTD